ncbi:MAG: UDP-N-acetylmuramate:L-alanyl-gamma-D-glutamyl-meso-diaminopimelate ligase [Gammaproteobacteria bacterium]
MRIHILGICGTFMGGIAVIAKQQGHEVTGSDIHVYPPMSTQLQEQGIVLHQGYHPEHLQPAPDLVIIGNALSRGNPAVEYVLNQRLPYLSAPQWLADHVLRDRWVLAVAGTHGKTTTTSLLTWILECAGLVPGFLIGGVANNFSTSARLGSTPFFVIEGDEYDSAFFDKRSKFLHYRPKTLVLNNLEYDHADIFADMAVLKQTFHFLLRTIPANGQIIAPSDDRNLQLVMKQGCWTPVTTIVGSDADWQAKKVSKDCSRFEIAYQGQYYGAVQWSLLGEHNIANALAAVAAAQHVGVAPEIAINALNSFAGVKRRLEVKGQVEGITVYDDFAHHPTAIAATLKALRAKVNSERIIAVMEFGSYTMRQGCHKISDFVEAFLDADEVILLRPENVEWEVQDLAIACYYPTTACDSVEDIIATLITKSRKGDHILIMSNKDFAGIHEKLLAALAEKKSASTST